MVLGWWSQAGSDGYSYAYCPFKRYKDVLGLVYIFIEFIPDYATKSAELYNMIKPTINWDLSTWKEDYVTDFENLKNAFAEWVAWYFQIGAYDGFCELDASDIAVCNALLMVEQANGRDVFSL